MNDEEVVIQGHGCQRDCPLCASNTLYIFAVGQHTFANCTACGALIRNLAPNITIGQIKSQLVAQYHP